MRIYIRRESLTFKQASLDFPTAALVKEIDLRFSPCKLELSRRPPAKTAAHRNSKHHDWLRPPVAAPGQDQMLGWAALDLGGLQFELRNVALRNVALLKEK
jgi:hypothetical protein